MTGRTEGIAKLRAFLAERFANRHTITLDERRRGLEALGTMLSPPVTGVEVEDGVLGGIPATRFQPSGGKACGRRILYLHGGAFVTGSGRSHSALLTRLALAAWASIDAVAYRLAPEHPFPAAGDDCLAAYRALLEDGCPPEKITIAGDSAGGALALGLLVAARDAGLPMPGAAVLISPALDLTAENPFYDTLEDRDPFMSRDGFRRDVALYLNADPKVSPLFANLAGLPPILVQVGSEEVLLGDALALAQRAALVRTPVTLQVWPDMVHVWHVFPNWLADAERAIKAIANFLDTTPA